MSGTVLSFTGSDTSEDTRLLAPEGLDKPQATSLDSAVERGPAMFVPGVAVNTLGNTDDMNRSLYAIGTASN